MPWRRIRFGRTRRRGRAERGSCGSDGTGLVTQQQVGFINIQVAPQAIERGTRLKFTAIVVDVHDQVINVPVVWRSSNQLAAVFDANGVLTAIDVGTTNITASSLGNIVGPDDDSSCLERSGRHRELRLDSAERGDTGRRRLRLGPCPRHKHTVRPSGARVAFAATVGAGTVSPASATQCKRGRDTVDPRLEAGVNTVRATVVDSANQPLTFVQHSPVKFSVKSYAALSAVAGDQQTAQILSRPAHRSVGQAGRQPREAARPGVPITFSATSGGRVAIPTVSTGADGVASPGTWTLGDVPGPQNLVARVESGTFNLQATGTGTPIHYDARPGRSWRIPTCGLDSAGASLHGPGAAARRRRHGEQVGTDGERRRP